MSGNALGRNANRTRDGLEMLGEQGHSDRARVAPVTVDDR
jgi:hypothetical protein